MIREVVVHRAGGAGGPLGDRAYRGRGLALLDSTSVGTLVVPGLLLARPAPPYRALPWYAGTLFLFYFLLGIAGLGGLDLIGAAADLRTTDLGLWVQLIVGAGLVLWGVLSRDTVAGASATGCGASPSG